MVIKFPNEKEVWSSIRKFISLKTGIQILDRLENQERITDIGGHFNLNESTIWTIKQTEDKL